MEYTEDFDNENSPVQVAYRKGVDKADYAIDMKLFDMAKGGDLKALQKYEERKEFQIRQEEKGRQSREFKNRYAKK